MTSDPLCIQLCIFWRPEHTKADIPFLGHIMSAVQIRFIEFCNSLNFEYFAKLFSFNQMHHFCKRNKKRCTINTPFWDSIT
jgi:hypothetical protein